jgi:cell division protein FtsN
VLNNLALSQAMTGDVDAGINLLRRAGQQTGASVQIRQNLALLLAMKGSLGEAERLVRADLPKEMADANMEVLARIAAKGGAATPDDLARLTTIQNVPRSEPIDVAAAEPSDEAVAVPEAGEGDLAAAASAAADEAMAALLAEPEPEAPAVAATAGAYRVQLASFRTELEATRERATLLARFPDLLDGDALVVRSVTLATGETVWRLYAGPFADRGAANDLCRSLAERSASCLVTVGGT